VVVRTASSCLRIGTGAGTCVLCNEPSGSIKCGEFRDFFIPVSFPRKTLSMKQVIFSVAVTALLKIFIHQLHPNISF